MATWKRDANNATATPHLIVRGHAACGTRMPASTSTVQLAPGDKRCRRCQRTEDARAAAGRPALGASQHESHDLSRHEP
jgi:hypothetical protein